MSSAQSEKYSSTERSYQNPSTDALEPRLVENNVSGESDKESCNSKIKSRMSKFGTCLSKFRLELVVFLFTFAYTMKSVSSTTMIIDKVCLVHLEYPPFICSNLDNFTETKASVEKLATNYQLGRTLIQTAPAALLACFMAPWSDHYGRKFPIILALFGMILDGIGSTVCAYFLETRVEYFFIPAIFTGIFGGQVTILAVVYSYASDCTSLVERTMKYAFVEMAAGFSIPFGSAAGGWIFKFLGYPAVFFFSTGGLCLSFIWVVFLLRETRGSDNDHPWSVKLKEMFSCKSFLDSFSAVAKDRPHKGRRQIVLLIISMCFLVITINSTGDINYLYVHHQFGWDNTVYSTVTAVYSVISIVVLIIVIPVMKRYRVGDPFVGLVGTTSLLGRNIGMALSWKKGIYHAANLFGALGGCSPFAGRSRISKMVSDEDRAKVFSFVATAESLLPVLTTVLMSQLFTAFLETFPGMPYLTLAILLLLPLAVFIWMTCLPKLSYEDMARIAAQGSYDIHSSMQIKASEEQHPSSFREERSEGYQ